MANGSDSFLLWLFAPFIGLFKFLFAALLLPMLVLSLLAVLAGASPGAIGATLGEAMENITMILVEVLLRLPGILFNLGLLCLRAVLLLAALFRGK